MKPVYSFLQAIDSGHPFRIPGDAHWIVLGAAGVFHVLGDPRVVVAFKRDDFDRDYELLENHVTITEQQLAAALASDGVGLASSAEELARRLAVYFGIRKTEGPFENQSPESEKNLE
jgi:hypothetical protein